MNDQARRDYYVYGYANEDGEFYYIGKGKNNRAYTKHDRVQVPEDRERIVILIDNLTDDEAYAKETDYIRQIGRADQNKGPLLNLNDGGRGGRCIAPSTLIKIKERFASAWASKQREYTLYNRPRKDKCVYEECSEFIYKDGLCMEHFASEQENEYGRDFVADWSHDPDYEDFVFVL